MPPRYRVHAQVVDIRQDQPRATDRFLVDTNVWGWVHYRNCLVTPTGAAVQQVAEYPPYYLVARKIGAVRFRAASCYVELSSVVERTEHETFVAGCGPRTLKDYRHNEDAERQRVEDELRLAWGLIKADGLFLPPAMDDADSDDALARFGTERVDGYDAMTLRSMRAAGLTQILSDDGDFCTAAGITLFTANPRVIGAAHAQGRLVVR